MDSQPLAGRTVAVPETREIEIFAAMLERRGATVIRCPMVAIRDAPDPAPVLQWSREFAQGSCDDLILLTGEGLRRIVACLDRHEPALKERFLDSLARARKITRGPKPARALREIGLNPSLRAETPTTEGVIAALSAGELAGRRIGIQLPPDAPPRLADFLREAGALPDPVVPYAYVPRANRGEIVAVIEEMTAGRVDAIAFTSAPQVARLFAAAADAGEGARLVAALRATPIAAVGPVVAAELERRGLEVAIMPRDSFFMKPLVTAIVAALSG
jgi:uroporphyrinogen-III synthase